MSYACVRTDNASGTLQGKNLVSVCMNSDVENGTIIKVGALKSGERELRAGTLAAVGDALSELAIVASPEVIKTKSNYGLDEFINKAGDAMRCYRLTSKDVFSVTKEAFAASQTPAVGNIVEVNGSGKMIAVSSATSNSTTIGHVLAIEGKWYVIEIA